MIFPEKPQRWTQQQIDWTNKQAKLLKAKIYEPKFADNIRPKPRPAGYWRERIEFAIICVGLYFWISYWWQYQ